MNKSILILAATTVAGAVASVYFWQQLQSAHARADALQTRVTELELALARPAPATAPSLAAQPAVTETAQPAAQTPAPATVADAESTAIKNPARVTVSSSDLMKDPDFRASVAASLRQSLAQNYQEFFKEAALSPEQNGKLLDIMSNRALATSGLSIGTGSGQTSARDAVQASAEAQRKQEEEIRALLGDAKAQQWKDYQESLPARQQVTQLRASLESTGAGLNQVQQRQLISVMAAEQKRQTAEMTRIAQTQGGMPRDGAAALEQMVQFSEDSNRRVLDASMSYLSPQQLDALRTQQNQQLGATRALLRMQRPSTATSPPSGTSAGN